MVSTVSCLHVLGSVKSQKKSRIQNVSKRSPQQREPVTLTGAHSSHRTNHYTGTAYFFFLNVLFQAPAVRRRIKE